MTLDPDSTLQKPKPAKITGSAMRPEPHYVEFSFPCIFYWVTLCSKPFFWTECILGELWFQARW